MVLIFAFACVEMLGLDSYLFYRQMTILSH
jgi:hypothetical protein